MDTKHTFILQGLGKHFAMPEFFIPGKPLDSNSSEFPAVQAPDETVRMNSASEDCELTSMFGQPVWADVILKDNVTGGRELQLLWVIVTVSNRKNIVKTAIQGRAGTVKEFISDGDYEITLEGGLFDQNPSRYPIEYMNTLQYLCTLKEAIPVTSEFLQLFGINKIVIESRDFKQEEGTQNVQLFTIRAFSDEDIILNEET
jgi:hypothetical protein